MRGSPAGTDAGGTRHGRRLGASSEHPPTRPAAQLSVGLKNAAALSKAQKHRIRKPRQKLRVRARVVLAGLRHIRRLPELDRYPLHAIPPARRAPHEAAALGRYEQRAIRRSALFVATLDQHRGHRADYCFDPGASTKAASARCALVANLRTAHRRGESPALRLTRSSAIADWSSQWPRCGSSCLAGHGSDRLARRTRYGGAAGHRMPCSYD